VTTTLLKGDAQGRRRGAKSMGEMRRHRWGAALAALLMWTAACEGALTNPERDDAPGQPGPGTTPETPSAVTPFVPAEAVLPRLTNAQYRSALRELLDVQLPEDAALEADTNPYLFYSIGASTTQLSAYGVERYDESARVVAATIAHDPARMAALLGDCAPSAADDACAQRFIERQGARLYRRPLSAEEQERWLSIARDTALPGQPTSGLEMVLAGMLQSPHFLYRVELGEPDPAHPDQLRYTSVEMASRLAALLWNSVPDDALLDAAASGQLVEEQGLRAQVDRMLADKRARAATQDFFVQYLDLHRLDKVQRDPERYPGYTPALLDAMRTEVRLLVDDLVFRRDADIRTLFSTRRSFVNDQLAALYEVDAPGATPYAFVPVEFPTDSPRAGILTLAAFLTSNAHPTETSPTLRGKYLRERLLCQTVPPPPDNVSFELAQMDGQPRSLRERLEQHRSNPSCAGCHAFIDPPGYLFERFDSVGRYREVVDGLDVDSSGELNGVKMDDSSRVGEVLLADGQLSSCMVKQLYRHASARLNTSDERAALLELEAEFERSGYRFNALLRAMALSDGFRRLASPRGETP
jgi:hypothetical protein